MHTTTHNTNDNHPVGTGLRAIASAALQAAHHVADGATEVRRHPASGAAGEPIGEAGVRALAHVARGALDMAAGRESLAHFVAAEAELEKLPGLLAACETQGMFERDELAPLYHAITEALGLVRLAIAGPGSQARAA